MSARISIGSDLGSYRDNRHGIRAHTIPKVRTWRRSGEHAIFQRLVE